MDVEYCVRLAVEQAKKDETGTTAEEIRELMDQFFEKGYDVWYRDKRHGVVFGMNINGFYTLDGYNEGFDTDTFFAAVEAGKRFAKELFQLTPEIYTCHKSKNRVITRLAERIGFKRYKNYGDFIILKMENSYGN